MKRKFNLYKGTFFEDAISIPVTADYCIYSGAASKRQIPDHQSQHIDLKNLSA